MLFVPVVNQNQEPLMPTIPSRARRWIKSGKATPFWKKGVFCVRLNIQTQENKQDVVVGIDPGSKKEGFTVKSTSHTYLNIQADAVTWVKDAVERRRNARRARRNRKTPCRKARWNRKGRSIAPSTKARWQWKLRILNWLKKMFPIAFVIVEDIKARTTGQKRWDLSFSPLQVGKKWFYEQVGDPILVQGYETKQIRDLWGLKKSSNKLSNSFGAHCVDSWVLANGAVGGHEKPDNTDILFLTPLQFHRRQLHVFQFAKGGIRKKYGGTRSLGFKRGSLVKHPKYGLTYVGGVPNADRISLHSLEDGKRIYQNAKPQDCRFLSYNSWRCRKEVT